MPARTKLMIVDDSAAARAMLVRGLGRVSDLEVAGTAANGKAALDLLPALEPDVVVLDVEMPEMDGLAALEALRALRPALPVIMFSSLTRRGAATTFEALSRGAADYVAKPESVGASLDAWLLSELVPKIRALAPRERGAAGAAAQRGVGLGASAEVVAIGASTGGPRAIEAIFSALPRPTAAPILVVQHMPAVFTQLFAARLAACSGMPVSEARGGERLRAGEAWVAPGDHHLRLVRRGASVIVEVSKDAPERGCRPSVDVLFRSVAAAFGKGAVGVILTGMGQDGLRGASDVRNAGGRVFAQDEATSIVWGMAGGVARAGLADAVLPLPAMVEEIARAVEAR